MGYHGGMSIEPEPRPDEFEPEEAEPEEEYAPVGDHPDDATAHAAEADLLEQEQEVEFDEDDDAPDLAEEDRA
jgi:hypothetical protein